MKTKGNKRLDIQQHKVIFIVVTAFLALLVASPVLQKALVYPQTEFFTELWLLGPQHSAKNYPYNITNNSNYSIFLDVTNHLGSCAYYVVEVKFRNQTQSAPDSFNRTHSSLVSLYSVNVFLADNASWELPITFSFDYNHDSATSTIYLNRLQFNDVALNLNGYSTMWDPGRNAFFGDLVFEIWLYNSTIGGFQYHERYVDLKLNFQI
jgi:uncharacterized membrane protein